MREIESANPDAYRRLRRRPWTNKERFSDATLKELIEHYSQVTLSHRQPARRRAGNGYEYLIKRFADDSGHTAAEFYTNRTLVHLMAQMLDAEPGESRLRPHVRHRRDAALRRGTHLRCQGKEHRTCKLFGQERNFTTSSIARMNCSCTASRTSTSFMATR